MWEQVSLALNDSAARVVTTLVRLLPAFVALLLSFLIAVGVAAILRSLVRRLLRSVHFDEHLTQWGVADVPELGPANRPTEWVARSIFWFVIFVGVLIGLAAFDSTLTSGLIYSLIEYLPSVLAATLIVVAGKIVARYLERSVLIAAVNMNVRNARMVSLGVKWLVLITAVAMALDHLGIGRRIVYLAFGIFFGGIVLAAALAVGLGSKDQVRRSLEQQSSSTHDEATFHHL